MSPYADSLGVTSAHELPTRSSSMIRFGSVPTCRTRRLWRLFPLQVVVSVKVEVAVGAAPSPNEDELGLIHRLNTLVEGLTAATMNCVVLRSSWLVAHAAEPEVTAPCPKTPRLYFDASVGSMRTWTLPGVTVGLPVCDELPVLFMDRKNAPVVLFAKVRSVTFSRNE